MKTPIDITEPSPTITPSTTSERAPMKQSSSMMVGLACSGSSTPPIPTPPERCTFLPIWAQEPTVTQVSTMVFDFDIGAEIDEARHQHHVLRDEGRAAHDGAGHRAEARLAEALLPPALEFRGNLVPPGRPARAALDNAVVIQAERKQHGLFQPLVDLPRIRPGRVRSFSATRALPESSARSACSTASRTSPVVCGPIFVRSSKACSISVCNRGFVMGMKRPRRK